MDGESKIPSPELITETGATSENTSATETKNPQPRKQLRDFHCRTFAFIGGEEPHFIFSGSHGEWGRLYVTDTQIALCVENGSAYIGNLVRSGAGKG